MSIGNAKTVTATGAIATNPCTIAGVQVAGGADASVVSLYDTHDIVKIPVASANLLGRYNTAIVGMTISNISFRAYNGVYCVLDSGTTPTITVYVS